MTIKALCKLIDLHPVMTELVLENHAIIDFSVLSTCLNGLQHRSTWNQAFSSIQIGLDNDPDGIKMLAVLLDCVLATHDVYRKMNIPEPIFIDTMKFFSRFVEFDMSIHGRPAFHWGWWSPRQISAVEFRIGALEYEMIDDDSGKIISLHIPSDADLSLTSLRESYLAARAFFARYFPEYADSPMHCNTWMLAPVLKELLPSHSRILGFQRWFVVNKIDEDSRGFMRWIYSREDIPFESLPDKTFLQKAAKQHLLAGGKIGWAFGILSNDPFI